MTAQDEERLRRIHEALAEYRATLARLPVIGFGRTAELDQLADLIRQHPDEARSILDDQNAENDEGSGGPGSQGPA